jgi:hypothetical protein
MAPKRPRGEESGSEPGIGAPVSPPSGEREARGGDIAFMEQILLELSEQNEHARAEGMQRSGEPAPDAAGAAPPRPQTVRVDRDSEFRTPEGIPSARAYLPSKTLAPGRKEEIDTETVRVADPRKLPTMRRMSRPNAQPATDGRRERFRSSSDDNAPTLRSAAPVAADGHRPETRRWIGWVVVAAVAGALVVALAARFGAAPARPPRPVVSVEAPSVNGTPSPRASTLLSASPPASSPPSPNVAPSAASSEPSARPRSAPKSDRWY